MLFSLAITSDGIFLFAIISAISSFVLFAKPPPGLDLKSGPSEKPIRPPSALGLLNVTSKSSNVSPGLRIESGV